VNMKVHSSKFDSIQIIRSRCMSCFVESREFKYKSYIEITATVGES
jgi:hypothetical protein